MSRLIGSQYTVSTGPLITTFTSSGTFTSGTKSTTASYLVVAGEVSVHPQMTAFLLVLQQVIQLQ